MLSFVLCILSLRLISFRVSQVYGKFIRFIWQFDYLEWMLFFQQRLKGPNFRILNVDELLDANQPGRKSFMGLAWQEKLFPGTWIIRGMGFKLNFLGKFSFIIENYLGCKSGVYVWWKTREKITCKFTFNVWPLPNDVLFHAFHF